MRKADHELQGAPARGGHEGGGSKRSQVRSPARERDRKSDRGLAAPRLTDRANRAPLRLEPELTAEFAAIADAAGCELVHAELRGNVLRILIDREDGGVTLNDCELISKHVSAFLDVVDFGKGRYVLEVGSPGLDRELYGPRDYQRFVGRLVRVTFEPPEGRKRTVVGRLQAFTPPAAPPEGGAGGGPGALPGALTIALEKDGETTGEELHIGLDTIKLARLEIEL